MDEAPLVEQAQRGDHAAFTALVSTHGHTLFGLALRITHDPAMADDAVQEALIAAWRELPRLRDPGRFVPWLIRIVVRSSSRQARTWRPGSPVDTLAVAPQTRTDVEAVAERDAMERAFARISHAHRTVLVLRFYADLETQDIAAVLGVPAGTVRSRLHYAIDALRSALDAEERSSGHDQ